MPDNRETLTMKLDPRLMARIAESAAREGKSRNAYVLQWLPDNYEQQGNTWRRQHPPADL
jgi:predicted HicB family RNase H-like nuclease